MQQHRESLWETLFVYDYSVAHLFLHVTCISLACLLSASWQPAANFVRLADFYFVPRSSETKLLLCKKHEVELCMILLKMSLSFSCIVAVTKENIECDHKYWTFCFITNAACLSNKIVLKYQSLALTYFFVVVNLIQTTHVVPGKYEGVGEWFWIIWPGKCRLGEPLLLEFLQSYCTSSQVQMTKVDRSSVENLL